jgi:hypothetical protein
MPRYSRDTAKVGVEHQSFGNQVTYIIVMTTGKKTSDAKKKT